MKCFLRFIRGEIAMKRLYKNTNAKKQFIFKQKKPPILFMALQFYIDTISLLIAKIIPQLEERGTI